MGAGKGDGAKLWTAWIRYDEDNRTYQLPPCHGEACDIISILPDKSAAATAQQLLAERRAAQVALLEAGNTPPPTTFDEFILALRPCRRTLPIHLWKSWSLVVKHHLTVFRSSCSTTEKTAAAISVMTIPSRFVPLDKRYDEFLVFQRPTPPTTTRDRQGQRNDSDLDDEDGRALSRAQSLAHQGLLRKAAQALAPAQVADLADPELARITRSKFPGKSAPLAHSIERKTIPPFDGVEISRSLKKMANGASGGLSGWTKELLSAAIAMDPSIANDLGIFLAEVLSENLDQIVADIFRASMLVALIKPGTKIDIRPIGAADGMQKLLGACCYDADKPSLPAWQLGVGAPNATVRIIEEARDALEAGMCVMTLDAHNAFNSISQAWIEARLLLTTYARMKQFYRFNTYSMSFFISNTIRILFQE